jgi:hypothetical protein
LVLHETKTLKIFFWAGMRMLNLRGFEYHGIVTFDGLNLKWFFTVALLNLKQRKEARVNTTVTHSHYLLLWFTKRVMT